jgi:transposase
MEHAYRVFVGIDWANQVHEVWATDADNRPLGRRQVLHRGVALAEMVTWLIELAEGEAGAVAVAIETPHGPIVDTLVDRGCHVFAINPKQLDRFRDRFSPSGAKDDRRDAEVMSHAVRTDRATLRAVHVGDPVTRQLRETSRHDAELQEDFQRLANRLRDHLLSVWPELLALAPAADEPWLWTLLELAPTPTSGERLRPARVRQLLREHRIRRLSADEVLKVLRAPSVYLAPGVREGVVPRIADLIEQLRVVHAQRRKAEHRLEAALRALGDETPAEKSREHRDVEILQSLPGIGTRIAATMLAEAAQPLLERDYHALRVLGGCAPVTRRSGKSCVVHIRQACNGRVRFALRCWAMGAISHDPLSREHYDRLRGTGQGHERALRGVVDRLMPVLMAMLRDGTLYDATRRKDAAEARQAKRAPAA